MLPLKGKEKANLKIMSLAPYPKYQWSGIFQAQLNVYFYKGEK